MAKGCVVQGTPCVTTLLMRCCLEGNYGSEDGKRHLGEGGTWFAGL